MTPHPAALTLHGAAADLFHCQRREVVISGPAGTGKSIGALAKLHVLCMLAPNLRCLIVRKTRESLSESALVTFEQKVVPAGHPILNGQQRRTRQNYTYPNGSQIILGGMDKPSKIMSTEYDAIYCQEGIELTVDDWEALVTRLRNGRLPYQQILADTNPDTPHHWIKQREAEGKLILLESRHEDNPRLYDRAAGRWTPDGVAYLATLDQLTGPRLQRLRHGRWVQAEGAVYDTFDRAVHVADAKWWGVGIPPAEWPRYWAIDFGYIHPFVCLWGAVDSDGRLWIYKQWVKTQKLVEDHAKVMLHELAMEERTLKLRANAMRRERTKEFGEEATARWFVEQMETIPGLVKPRAILCDHDAEDRATLQRHLGMQTTAAYKAIGQGVQAVQGRLRVQGDGKPRLLILRDSVMERDAAMKAASLPIGLAEEMEGYVWDTRMGRRKGEEPLDKGNHTLDALRYLTCALDVNPRKEVKVW